MLRLGRQPRLEVCRRCEKAATRRGELFSAVDVLRRKFGGGTKPKPVAPWKALLSCEIKPSSSLRYPSPVLAVTIPKLTRRHLGVAFKHPREVRLIGEAEPQSDLGKVMTST